MTSFTYKVQYTENFFDEYIQKGLVEKEKAVEEFQLFPWDKEIDEYLRRSDNPTIPKIIFNSDDNRQLIIEAVNTKGYAMEYSNFKAKKYSDFYISNDFEKKNLAPEEIIECFFDNTLELHLKLIDILEEETKQPKEEKIPKNIVFTFQPRHFDSLGYLVFVYMTISAIIFRVDQVNSKRLHIFAHFFLLFSWLPTFVLHITYYFKNRSATFTIDTENNEATYIKGSKQVNFKREDIFRCQVTTAPHRQAWKNYSYVWFILHNGTYICITSFMAEPLEVVKVMSCKFEETERFVPLLPI